MPLSRNSRSPFNSMDTCIGQPTGAWHWWLSVFLCVSILALSPWLQRGWVFAEGSEVQPVESGPSIKRLRVQVLPEFDDPRILVVVQGRISADADEFPMPLTVRIPAGAVINQMATMNMSTGGAAPQTYDIRLDIDDATWSIVTYTIDNPHFFYEYYYDLPMVGTDKEFGFVWYGTQVVEEMLLEVQQPATASDFHLTPTATGSHVDPTFGLTYHEIAVGRVEAGEKQSILVGYTKEDPAPSLSREDLEAGRLGGRTSDVAELLAVSSAAGEMPRPQQQGTQPASFPEWPIALGALLIVLAVVVIVARQLRDATAVVPNPILSGNGYCHKCGADLRSGAMFCHHCGTPVRTETAGQPCS